MKYISSTTINYAVRSRRQIEEKNMLAVIHNCRIPKYSEREHWLQYGVGSNLIVSSFGQVRRYNKRGGMTEIVNDSDLRTRISFMHKGKTIYVRNIVAECFAAVGSGDRIVNINGDIYDNKIDNLCYIRSSEIVKSALPRKNSVNISISQYTLSGKFLCSWKNADEAAERQSFRRGDILMCAEGRVLSAHNYIWTFATNDRKFQRLPSAEMKAEMLQRYLIRAVYKDNEYIFVTLSDAAKWFMLSEFEIMKRCMIVQDYDGWVFSYPGESYERSQIIWKE